MTKKTAEKIAARALEQVSGAKHSEALRRVRTQRATTEKSAADQPARVTTARRDPDQRRGQVSRSYTMKQLWAETEPLVPAGTPVMIKQGFVTRYGRLRPGRWACETNTWGPIAYGSETIELSADRAVMQERLDQAGWMLLRPGVGVDIAIGLLDGQMEWKPGVAAPGAVSVCENPVWPTRMLDDPRDVELAALAGPGRILRLGVAELTGRGTPARLKTAGPCVAFAFDDTDTVCDVVYEGLSRLGAIGDGRLFYIRTADWELGGRFDDLDEDDPRWLEADDASAWEYLSPGACVTVVYNFADEVRLVGRVLRTGAPEGWDGRAWAMP